MVLRHTGAPGKGAAMQFGFEYAYSQGFTHVIQIDADGQQDAQAIPEILVLAMRHQNQLICAVPNYNKVPLGRFYGSLHHSFLGGSRTWTLSDH